MRRQLKRDLLLGGIGYPILEMLYRGRSHPAMALAGGLSLALLRHTSRIQKGRPLWQQALWGGLSITALEYTLGRSVNRDHNIWDYRHMPLNVGGQVCLAYTACWCALSAAVLALMRETKGV